MSKENNAKKAPAKKLTTGRIVKYLIHNTEGKIIDRPAMVVNVGEKGLANLQIFLDGTSDMKLRIDQKSAFDGTEAIRGMAYRKDVVLGNNAGEWRWPDQEGAAK